MEGQGEKGIVLFSHADKVILIEKPVAEVTIQQLINQIREFEASEIGMVVASLANGAGKQSLGGGKAVGITLELINDWRVQFENRIIQTFCYIRGGNLVAKNSFGDNPIKPSVNVNVVLELSTSASLIEGSGSPWNADEKNEAMSKLDDINIETDKISDIKTETDKISGVKSETDKIQGVKDTVETNEANILSILSDLGFVKEIEGGKWQIVDGQMIFYKADNATEIARFNIAYDAEGNPIMRTRI